MEKEKLDNNYSNKPGVHPRTPNSIKFTSSSSSSLSYSSSSIISPLPKRFNSQKQMHRIRNPFEHAWERLHLPLIASPSLFQRPSTPQLSSTQFEWTIEDVSSLKPAQVEAHETQFQDSPDSDYEAKVQSAISSFFKEQQIVPSPINSAMQQRVILAEINGNTPIAKPGRRIRDCGTQTILSLPLDLPPSLEEALRPYLQSHLVDDYGEPICNDNGNDDSPVSSNKRNNTSMRRKLFDIHNIFVVDENGKSLNSGEEFPMQTQSPHSTEIKDNFDSSENSSDSHTSLHNSSVASPLSDLRNSFESPSSSNKASGRSSFLFKSPNALELSPIYPTRHKVFSLQKKHEDPEDKYQNNCKTPVKAARENSDALSNEEVKRSPLVSNCGGQCLNFDDVDNELTTKPTSIALISEQKRE